MTGGLLFNLRTGDEYTGHVLDWDQRKWVLVKGPASYLVLDEDIEIEVMKRYVDLLAPTVHAITADNSGLLVSVSSKPEDDATLLPPYLRLSKSPSLQNLPTIQIYQVSKSWFDLVQKLI